DVVNDKLGAGSDEAAGDLRYEQPKQGKKGIAVDVIGSEAQGCRHPSWNFMRRRTLRHRPLARASDALAENRLVLRLLAGHELFSQLAFAVLGRLSRHHALTCGRQIWNGPMHLSQFHYLPLTPGFFSILVALFVGLLVVLVVIGALRHAYLSLGVSPGTAMLLLLGSLIGSYFNIPIAALPPEQVESDKVIEFFGVEYTVPMVANLPGTVIAINVGGAII